MSKAKKRSKVLSVPNTLPHLLDAVWHHPDCPDWLQDAIWRVIDDRINGQTRMSPNYWASQLESARPDGVEVDEFRRAWAPTLYAQLEEMREAEKAIH